MKVLVLGANGQLGSDILRAAGQDSRAISAVPMYRRDLDVARLDSISAALRNYEFDALINCTSYHRIDEAELHAPEAFAINAHAVRRLAQACRDHAARFVQISTDYVFDGNSAKPYEEHDAPAPLNVYGASKRLGEELALEEHPEGVLILRLASLFGLSGSSGKGGNFVETIIRIAREKGRAEVINDITMSPTSSADVTRIILQLLQAETPSGIYHVVNSGQATWFDFACQIVARARLAAQVIPITSDRFPSVAVRPRYSVLDNRKVAAMVGPIPCWEDSLGRYLSAKGHIS
jgi:dTDP-4-dehydrorhamnose reductase